MDDKILTDLLESLSREIGSLRQDVKDGFQRVEIRLARLEGILNGGARQMVRMIAWSGEIDAMLVERDARIAELAHRVDRLEAKH